MSRRPYRSMDSRFEVTRRDLLAAAGAAGLVLGSPALWAEETAPAPPAKPKTNIADALKVPRTKSSLPGPFQGRVVQVHDPKSMKGDAFDGRVVRAMFKRGIERLTGKNLKESFGLFFNPGDIVGIKISPAGGAVNSTRPEVVDAVVEWLKAGGIPAGNIILWDRFDYMLKDAGFTPQRFPGVKLEGLQTMDEAAAEGKADDSRWLTPEGRHISEPLWDTAVTYWADIEAPQDKPYLNQHVFNGKDSYFGKLVTQRLTKIVNIPVFKNTGNGVSMATKNLGYGAICNTGRLHKPLFFDVCTEVLAFPCLRDKIVLNINDGLLGQYDGGPMPAPQFTYPNHTLYFATDPFAMDAVGQAHIIAKRKAMGVKVNEHPRYTDYLRYAETLGLGVVDPAKLQLVRA